MRLAVIPARGGSKRIPRKNVRPFHGKPIIGWSIEAAKKSGCFDRIIVSTDDDEIASVARSFGAETPFVRPPELSNDFAPTGSVVAHAVRWQMQTAGPVDHACCIYATAPFLTPEVIKCGLKCISSTNADFAVTVTSFPFPIQRACRISEDRLEIIDPDQYLVRSQDLEETFHDAGQLYWGRAEAWIEGMPMFGGRTVPIRLHRHQVQDIDTVSDWEYAEILFDAIHVGAAK